MSDDVVGSKKDVNPITGSWFRLEKGPVAIPPQYEHDEVGILVEGMFRAKLWNTRNDLNCRYYDVGRRDRSANGHARRRHLRRAQGQHYRIHHQ